MALLPNRRPRTVAVRINQQEYFEALQYFRRDRPLETALGGHLVKGHVDGVGKVVSFEKVAQEDRAGSEVSDRLLAIELPDEMFPYAVEKGSISIDGISLTIAAVGADNTVTMTIVPYTLDKTTVAGYVPGTEVNIEVDIIAKYVRHYLMKTTGDDKHPSEWPPQDVSER